MKKEFELYQDEEGNVYDITTDLEQIIIKDLYKAMKRNNEKQDEIERLHSIIKEVREKIDNLGTYELLSTEYISKREVMKILDKESEVN